MAEPKSKEEILNDIENELRFSAENYVLHHVRLEDEAVIQNREKAKEIYEAVEVRVLSDTPRR